MPDRMIRAACCTSRNLLRVSGDAERLFFRLTTQADDLGRFRADASLVLAGCFPRALEDAELLARFSMAAIDGWLLELVDAELVTLYVVNGSRYGAFITWNEHQRLRNSKGKYPEPPPSGEVPQVAAGCREMPQPAAHCETFGDARLTGARARPSDSVSVSSSVSSSELAAQDTARAREAPRIGGCTLCAAPPDLDPGTANLVRRQLPRADPLLFEYVARWFLQRGSEPDAVDLSRTLSGLKRLHPLHEVRAHYARLTDPAMPPAEQQFHTLKKFRENFALYGPTFDPRGGKPHDRGRQQHAASGSEDRAKWAGETRRGPRADRLSGGSAADPDARGDADATAVG